MKVEILKTFGSQKKGEKIEVSESIFKMLQKKGFFVEVKTEKTKVKKSYKKD